MDQEKAREIAKMALSSKVDGADPEWKCPERCFFYTMRDIYRKFQGGQITKETGETLKKAAEVQYARDQDEYFWHTKVLNHNAAMWKEIELAATRYRNDPSTENADRFMAAVYGVGGKKPAASVTDVKVNKAS